MRLAVLGLVVAACDGEVSVSAPPPVLRSVGEPRLPRLESTECQLTEQPAHRLTITRAGWALDDAPLGDVPPALVVSWLERRELSLAFADDVPYATVRPILAALGGIRDLRLWISVRVADDPQVRHLPIGPPRLDAPRPTMLAPYDYTHHVDGAPGRRSDPDPLALPPGHQWVDHLFVSATDTTPWRVVADALAYTCDGASLIASPPAQESLPGVLLDGGPFKIDGEVDPKTIVLDFYRFARLQRCFERGISRGLAIRGRVGVTCSVDGTGRFTAATLDSPTPRDPELDACVALAMPQRLHEPALGSDFTVHFTFRVYPLAASDGRRVPHVEHGETNVDDVVGYIRGHDAEVRECYDAARDPAAEGRVTVGFTIGSGGMVSRSAVQADTLGEPEVARCIADAIRDWRFDAPLGGRPRSVRHSFLLTRG